MSPLFPDCLGASGLSGTGIIPTTVLPDDPAQGDHFEHCSSSRICIEKLEVGVQAVAKWMINPNPHKGDCKRLPQVPPYISLRGGLMVIS